MEYQPLDNMFRSRFFFATLRKGLTLSLPLRRPGAGSPACLGNMWLDKEGFASTVTLQIKGSSGSSLSSAASQLCTQGKVT